MTIDLEVLEARPEWEGFLYWMHRIGGGFHPDNRAADYEPPIEPAEAYDDAMEQAFGAGSPSPYEVGLAVIARGVADGQPTEPLTAVKPPTVCARRPATRRWCYDQRCDANLCRREEHYP